MVNKKLLDIISQVGISIFAVFGVTLMNCKFVFIGFNQSFWGGVIALIGQPFWFYTSIKHKQVGIIIASLLFTFAYSFSIYQGLK